METSVPYFTHFLGRYGKLLPPEKIYTNIPTNPSRLKLEFDFYEIDSWDTELFDVVINCVTIPLGSFKSNVDEGTREGVVQDVHFQISSIGALANRGFAGQSDQIHHVTIDLPHRFVNGLLQVKFETNLDESIGNESYGIDNIQLTGYPC